MISEIANQLNLNTIQLDNKNIYFPIKCQGHKGTDNKYYLINTQLYPPTTPDPDVEHCYLYKLLR